MKMSRFTAMCHPFLYKKHGTVRVTHLFFDRICGWSDNPVLHHGDPDQAWRANLLGSCSNTIHLDLKVLLIS